MTGFRGWAAAMPLRPALARAVGFFALWVVLSGGGSIDFLPGIIAALAAAWASLRLLPAGTGRPDPLAFGKFALRFLGQSVLAGADVARRAFDPALPLDPGFVAYATGLPPGPARNLFTALMSLLPGTVPLAVDASGALAIHCLDRTQPVPAQLAAEEALLVQVIGRTPRHG
jgi:multicomponent Na+:H+ antiporter subunit E